MLDISGRGYFFQFRVVQVKQFLTPCVEVGPHEPPTAPGPKMLDASEARHFSHGA